jgi:hypothetical protein
MKIYTSLLSLFLISLLASCSSIKKDCKVRDISGAKTDQELKLLKVFGADWMKNAMVCRMGEFEVATPADSERDKTNIIFVFKKGKPVFYRQDGGTYVYSPKLQDAAFEKVMVHIWHGADNEDVKRLWYRTVGKDPEVMIDDTNFDGQPDIRAVWKGKEIIEMYKWENNGWQRKKLKSEKP